MELASQAIPLSINNDFSSRSVRNENGVVTKFMDYAFVHIKLVFPNDKIIKSFRVY